MPTKTPVQLGEQIFKKWNSDFSEVALTIGGKGLTGGQVRYHVINIASTRAIALVALVSRKDYLYEIIFDIEIYS